MMADIKHLYSEKLNSYSSEETRLSYKLCRLQEESSKYKSLLTSLNKTYLPQCQTLLEINMDFLRKTLPVSKA